MNRVMKDIFNPLLHQERLLPLLKEINQLSHVSQRQYARLVKKYTTDGGKIFSKEQLIYAARMFEKQKIGKFNTDQLIAKIKMKPTRTLSGVAPITVLTKPFPCPGKCIFCPSDVRMPKSYLADEPGAQRAERNYFDPYLQTYNRLQALHNIGHFVDKAEIIILGGTWSFYPESYQIWFVKECFRALNDFGKKEDDRNKIENKYALMNDRLVKNKQVGRTPNPKFNQEKLEKYQIDGTSIDKSYNQTVSELYLVPEKIGGFDKFQKASWSQLHREQRLNEAAAVRNVGLVIETRPDNISEAEVRRIRKLGCTKAQIGVQSLSDRVLKLNHRGHSVAATKRAFKLLRQAGFKIHVHWMANLYGSSPEQDRADFDHLFNNPAFRPDELKIYPCSLIASAELMQYYKAGKWRPYTKKELSSVIEYVIVHTPQYARLTRIIRDIPATDIVEGNKLSNFRQVAEVALEKKGKVAQDIRAREIRNKSVTADQLQLDTIIYKTKVSQEYFLQYVTKDERRIAAFLRLSLPTRANFIAELNQAAIIREVHVYGSLVKLGVKDRFKSQHIGLGTALLDHAKRIAREHQFSKIAVISAVGTREYYRARGFTDSDLYQFSKT